MRLNKEDGTRSEAVASAALARSPRLQEMEKLTVDPNGTITIPPEIIEKRGLRPGDELALVESAEGFLVYQGGLDDSTLEWWSRLGDKERQLATTEARRYESLTEKERDAIWNERADSIEAEAESDEIELPTK